MSLVEGISILVFGMMIITALLARGKRSAFSSCLLWVIFAVYIAGNLYVTLLSREPGTITHVDMKPLTNYQHALAFEGGVEATIRQLMTEGWSALERISIQSHVGAGEIVLNILLYVPMGFLLPVLFRKWRYRRVVFAGFCCSLLTEGAQYLFQMGECSVSDLLNNTLGTIVGLAAYMIFFLGSKTRRDA